MALGLVVTLLLPQGLRNRHNKISTVFQRPKAGKDFLKLLYPSFWTSRSRKIGSLLSVRSLSRRVCSKNKTPASCDHSADTTGRILRPPLIKTHDAPEVTQIGRGLMLCPRATVKEKTRKRDHQSLSLSLLREVYSARLHRRKASQIRKAAAHDVLGNFLLRCVQSGNLEQIVPHCQQLTTA